MNKRRNLAFTIETLALTLFLLVVLALLVQLFGAAQRLGLQARRETDAALILQNVTAELHAGAGGWAEALAAAADGQGQTVTRLYAADGTRLADGETDPAAYTVTVALEPDPRPAGWMIQAHVAVSAPDGDELAALDTAHYLPGG